MWVGSRSLHFLCPKYLRKSPWTFVKSWWLSEWQLSKMGVASSCINKVKWDGETWRSAQWPRTFKRWDNSCVDKVWGEVSQEMRLIKNNGEFSFILSENSKQNHKGTPLHTQWKCLKWKKKTENSKCWWRGAASRPLIHGRWECKWFTLENCFQYLLKLNVHLLCDPAILLLGTHPTETCTYFHQKTYKKVHSRTISNSQHK